MKRHLVESVLIGVVLTALSYIVGIQAHWITALNWIEVFAVFTSYSSTYLCVKELNGHMDPNDMAGYTPHYTVAPWKPRLYLAALRIALMSHFFA